MFQWGNSGHFFGVLLLSAECKCIIVYFDVPFFFVSESGHMSTWCSITSIIIYVPLLMKEVMLYVAFPNGLLFRVLNFYEELLVFNTARSLSSPVNPSPLVGVGTSRETQWATHSTHRLPRRPTLWLTCELICVISYMVTRYYGFRYSLNCLGW